MTEQQKALMPGIREALKAMVFDTYEVLDHILPAHAVDWRRKFVGIERNLDALEAAGKCKAKMVSEGQYRWESDTWMCDRPECGEEWTMNHGHTPTHCPGCGREIEAAE